MFRILYDTNTYFQKQVWEEFFCKSLASVKRVLKKELVKDLENETIKKETSKEVLKKFDTWRLDRATMMSVWDLQIDCESEDFYIWVQEIELF